MVIRMCPLLQFEPVSLENDLALLELISPVKLKENIIPACLHKDRQYLGISNIIVAAQLIQLFLVGQRGWVTGWGITSEGEKNSFRTSIYFIAIFRGIIISSSERAGSSNSEQSRM